MYIEMEALEAESKAQICISALDESMDIIYWTILQRQQNS